VLFVQVGLPLCVHSQGDLQDEAATLSSFDVYAACVEVASQGRVEDQVRRRTSGECGVPREDMLPPPVAKMSRDARVLP
jgi:hypothetical protein